MLFSFLGFRHKLDPDSKAQTQPPGGPGLTAQVLWSQQEARGLCALQALRAVGAIRPRRPAAAGTPTHLLTHLFSGLAPWNCLQLVPCGDRAQRFPVSDPSGAGAALPIPGESHRESCARVWEPGFGLFSALRFSSTRQAARGCRMVHLSRPGVGSSPPELVPNGTRAGDAGSQL